MGDLIDDGFDGASPSEYHEEEYTIKHETPRSIGIEVLDGFGRPKKDLVFLPWSQCGFKISDDRKTVVARVPIWLAEKNGLI